MGCQVGSLLLQPVPARRERPYAVIKHDNLDLTTAVAVDDAGADPEVKVGQDRWCSKPAVRAGRRRDLEASRN